MREQFQKSDPSNLAGLMATEDCVSPAVPLSEAAGTRIGRYKLLQLIGEGGFGSVFMAEQETPVVRKVALKIIKLGMDTKQVIARFEAERQALAMMDHPNIARVLDAGATETGRPFFVMELVKGIPITDYCDQKRLSPKERLELFIPVCKAVQHAHQKGIIHRDLKPNNVMVTLHDGTPVPKVIDFGIAKAINQRLTEHTLFTEYRQLIGTPEYTSPEQADLSGLDVDTRSDIYSLGVLLYQLLTGTTPFDSKTLRSSAYGEVQRIIREVEPQKPSTRLSTMGDSLQTLADRMSLEPKRLSRLMAGELDWIVMKCLEKDRARRYDTASGLAADVQRHLNGEPVEALPPSAVYRVRKVIRRHRIPMTIGVVLLGATVFSSWQAFRATRANAALLVEKQRADEQASIANAVNDFINDDLLSQASMSRQEGRNFVPKPDLKVRDVLDRAAENIGSRFEKQPLVEARIRYTIGDAYADIREDTKAESELLRALAIQRRVVGYDHPDTLRTSWALVYLYRDIRRITNAIQLLEQVQQWQASNLGATNPHTLDSLRYLGILYRDAGRGADAAQTLEFVLAQMIKLPGAQHPQTLKVEVSLAMAYGEAGQKNQELKLLEQLCSPAGANADPETAQLAMAFLGWVYFEMGRNADAIKLLEEARDRGARRLAPAQRDLLFTMETLGAAYWAAGRKRDAIDLMEQVVQRYSEHLAKHAFDSDRWSDLSIALCRLGRFEEARDGFRKAVALQPDNPSYWHEGVVPLSLQLGDIEEYRRLRMQELLRFRGTIDPSTGHRIAKDAFTMPVEGDELQIARELAERGLGDAHPGWGAQAKAMGEYRAGDYREAIAQFTQNTAEWSYSRTIADLFVCMSYAQLGDRQQAIAILTRATRRMDQEFPKAGVDDVRPFQDWILCQVLRREAEALINGGKEPATEPASPSPGN